MRGGYVDVDLKGVHLYEDFKNVKGVYEKFEYAFKTSKPIRLMNFYMNETKGSYIIVSSLRTYTTSSNKGVLGTFVDTTYSASVNEVFVLDNDTISIGES